MELYRPTILSGTLVPLTTALDLSHNDHDSKILPSIAFWQLHTKGNTVYNLIYIPAKLIYYLPALSQSLLQFNFARIRTQGYSLTTLQCHMIFLKHLPTCPVEKSIVLQNLERTSLMGKNVCTVLATYLPLLSISVSS